MVSFLGLPIPIEVGGAAGFYIAALISSMLGFQDFAIMMIFVGTLFVGAELHKKGLKIWPPTKLSLVLVIVALFVFVAISLILAPDSLSGMWDSFITWVLDGFQEIGKIIVDWLNKWWWTFLVIFLIGLAWFLRKYVIMIIVIPVFWIKKWFNGHKQE